MKTYDNIKQMLCDELDEIAKKKELTTNSLDVLYKGVDILKDISTIEAMEHEYGYSNDGYSQNGYSGRMPVYMYDDGASYARGRGRYAQRDSMGRYADGSPDYSREGGYSRNDGYSREGMKDELRMMMDRAHTDKEREAIRKAMESM